MAEEKPDEVKAKGKGGILVIAGIAILTLVGAGGGWVVGNMIAPALPKAEDKAAAAGLAETEIPPVAALHDNIVQLESITANLGYPSESWVRLDVALAFNGAPDAAVAEAVHQDIMAFIRTVSLQQIAGPRGFHYLRDDIQERAVLRSEGKVARVLFRSFVIE